MMMRKGHKMVLEWVKETDQALATFKRNLELQAELQEKYEKVVSDLETEAKRENDDTKMV